MDNTDASPQQSALTTMIRTHPDSMLVFNREGEVLYANLAAKRLLCRLPACDGRLPASLRPFGADPIRINLKDIAGQELILSVQAQSVDWQGQQAEFVVIQDVTATQQQLRRLEQLVYRDELTNLYNRRGLEHAIGIFNALPANTAALASVMYIDINGLKLINDSLGHPYGDMAICETAQILRQVFHLTDIKARIGGDEFVVLVKQTDKHDLIEQIKQVHTEIERRNALPGRQYTLSLSIGSLRAIAHTPLVLDSVLAQADQCMYQAKQRQQNCVRHFDSTAVSTEPRRGASLAYQYFDLMTA